ncbi:hypothetical protein ES708_31998 [subsurface metagenome]
MNIHYKANITAGALLVPESRKIADLMLKNISQEEWKHEIEESNILQRLSVSSSKRIASFIKARLGLMSSVLWVMVRDGDATLSIQANFAAAIKHCRLLGDYMDIVIREQFKKMENSLPLPLWDEFIVLCEQNDPLMEQFPPSTAQKMRSNIHKILIEVGYLSDPYKRKLRKIEIVPDVVDYLKKNNEKYVLKCIEVGI